jgi:hypothetical protein
MFGCKACEIMRNEAYLCTLQNRDELNATDRCFSTAYQKETLCP